MFESKAEFSELPEFLEATEVAALLRVNRNTVYEAVQRDEIPGVVRIGRVLRFRRDAIIAWIHDG
ncbi:Helix-turn-helix domain protein [Enhygromyxa salina]|uniref:Helix-turn-helix domain protein n=1 Tax=Enhygromyxa salina TaxID=215803 RepID=A0A2S9XHF6_9BACT|nr:helix-turn-helix domain-containing protein [Enhygromyxa salina]PRP92170.1 Helix-turn-helix domain protein [Enhygromyxa salina]